MPETSGKALVMASLQHVSLLVDAATVIDTEAGALMGPQVRIGNGRDHITINLPLGLRQAIDFLDRLTAAVTALSGEIAEHGTAFSPPEETPAG
jgi:hypothetical protein